MSEGLRALALASKGGGDMGLIKDGHRQLLRMMANLFAHRCYQTPSLGEAPARTPRFGNFLYLAKHF